MSGQQEAPFPPCTEAGGRAFSDGLDQRQTERRAQGRWEGVRKLSKLPQSLGRVFLQSERFCFLFKETEPFPRKTHFVMVQNHFICDIISSAELSTF